MADASRIERLHESDLYVVITASFCAGRSWLDVLDQVLIAGVKVVQFREKDLPGLDLYQRARTFRERTNNAGALLIVNDRVDIALAVNADGVHLGQTDLPVNVAKSIAPNLIVGASTHSLNQALAAQNMGADYVNIGPIFETRTKTTSTESLGPRIIDEIAPKLRIPFTCMGGIKPMNIENVLRRGARHIAVVTAVTAADDVCGVAKSLREAILHRRGAA